MDPTIVIRILEEHGITGLMLFVFVYLIVKSDFTVSYSGSRSKKKKHK
ncbi:hypothetical protein [Desulfogranum marinum]|nr:hypothetical protein [Desulfogranum marinum]MBM9514700.1 hypothetical protein [Desulfogranum marinum]